MSTQNWSKQPAAKIRPQGETTSATICPLRRVACYVDTYNHVRLHSALGYITPADKLNGLETVIFAERDRKLDEAPFESYRHLCGVVAYVALPGEMPISRQPAQMERHITEATAVYNLRKNSISPLSFFQGVVFFFPSTSQLANALAFISRSTSAYTLVVANAWGEFEQRR